MITFLAQWFFISFTDLQTPKFHTWKTELQRNIMLIWTEPWNSNVIYINDLELKYENN